MELTGLYYSEDIQFRETTTFDPAVFNSGALYYEVLRIVDGTALFLEEHLSRLQHSVNRAGRSYLISVPLIHYLLRNLILRNNTANGNIRIILHFKEERPPIVYTFFIPHFYPGADLYEKGVDSALFSAERIDPNIKQVHSGIVEKINDFIREKKVYDALLVDSRGSITEGSKTNVFFIKNNTLYTAPEDKVLIGVTRNKIFLLCKMLNISIKEGVISTAKLNEFQTAFFSGTSPKILPIKKIDETSFDVRNPLMRNLMQEYDKMILNYLNHN